MYVGLFILALALALPVRIYWVHNKHMEKKEAASIILETFLHQVTESFHTIKWDETYKYDGPKRTNQETAKAINARLRDEVGPKVDVLLIHLHLFPEDYCMVFGQDPGSHDFIAKILHTLKTLWTEYQLYDLSDSIIQDAFKSKFFIETERVALSVLNKTYS